VPAAASMTAGQQQQLIDLTLAQYELAGFSDLP
jgi:hypothetical protein